jgi:hypothetical protein|tara:strand:+ start:136 stop:564 length:429 start_codon:yes stop_codon:yes gene_type:complete
MTLEELQDIVEKKLKINDTELDLEALKTPQLHNEFLKHYNKFKLMKTKASAELATIKLHKWEYYTGKADPMVYQQKPFNLKILKQDVDKYIEADEDYQKIKQKVDYLETIVDFLDRTIRQIQNRGFLIKDAIEWRKFTSGAI